VLVIAENQVLAPFQLQGLFGIHARLVFLSACDSAGATIGVAQVVSLPAMLVAAGTKAVISSYWPVDEMATLLLVSRFYELWQGGSNMAPSEALERAKGWLSSSTASTLRQACPPDALATRAGRGLSEAPDDSLPYWHPWFWAAFALTGHDGRGDR